MNLIDILDTSEQILEFDTISHISFYIYPDESYGLSLLLDIRDIVGDKEHYEENDTTSED